MAGPATLLFPLDQKWLFGGKLNADAALPQFDDSAFSAIALPHCVAKLSWQHWDPAAWETVWLYRRDFSLPKECANRRVFLKFDGVMVGAKPAVNGVSLAEHLGGYLPFSCEITQWLRKGRNVLDLAVDSRWQNVPPDGSPRGPEAVDYLQPGGILRPVALCAVPQVFICDVFAKPVDVLESTRRVEIVCSIDAAAVAEKQFEIKAELMDGARVVSSCQKTWTLEGTGKTDVALTMSNLGDIALWDVDAPRLYDVVATLWMDGAPLHEYRTRIGFREARFSVDGFFLNGRRLQLFGLNRHELYPYVGGAMPQRVLRRDAEILRGEFNCNIVRCSHYPQSEAFLDACDELGLMVWEETPGWGYLGDEAWKELVVRDVEGMVRRDRNHASIVVWGVRVNESANDQALYRRTSAVAKSLDGSRPASGSMTSGSRRNWRQEWHEDVFAFDDYHSDAAGGVGIDAPLPGVPYMLAETVGQFSYGSADFHNLYRRAGDLALQTQQGLFHAQAHNKAAAFPSCSGVIAWCAFDYASSNKNAHNAVKCAGVADVFRIPKLGAAFYQAQGSAKVRPVILPGFYWEFGPKSPRGPGGSAAIFSNCDRLDIFINGEHRATALPDRAGFSRLKHPPFFADLAVDGEGNPELRIDGYVGGALALSKSFSSDAEKDQFLLEADDAELIGDGADATRLAFRVADKFGAERLSAGGHVAFDLTGPGAIAGDNPFALADSGPVGAIWIKTIANTQGQIVVKATHSSLGTKTVAINVQPDARLAAI